MYNMSAAEGPKFAEAADEMTKRARDLGPNPLKRDKKEPQAA
jgi:coenzyme F420-reducing hydrogenase delta subunit